jgi:hypothetical protein
MHPICRVSLAVCPKAGEESSEATQAVEVTTADYRFRKSRRVEVEEVSFMVSPPESESREVGMEDQHQMFKSRSVVFHSYTANDFTFHTFRAFPVPDISIDLSKEGVDARGADAHSG